jgi:hypothetical protein
MPENVFRFDSSHLERFGGGPSRARSIAWCPIEAGSGVSKISIPLPDGRQLVTLQDAGTYITTLPEARAHRLAENADQFTKRCLLDLAEKYDDRLGRPSRVVRTLAIPSSLLEARLQDSRG